LIKIPLSAQRKIINITIPRGKAITGWPDWFYYLVNRFLPMTLLVIARIISSLINCIITILNYYILVN